MSAPNIRGHVYPRERTTTRTSGLAFLVFLLAVGCPNTAPPLGQLIVYVDTDAPVPDPSQEAANSPMAHQAPLFDRLRVTLFAPGATAPCSGCSAEFPLDAEAMRRLAFSFGILPRPNVPGSRIKLELYRSATLGEPRPESSITLVANVPQVSSEGDDATLVRTATLRVQDVGVPRGSLAHPVDLTQGPPKYSEVGSWLAARSQACAGDAPAGALCIPGGAFFMGDPRVTPSSGVAGRRERVVALSPFYLHDREVTVAMFRKSGLAEIDERGRLTDPLDDTNVFSACTFTIPESDRDRLPVNCISHGLARRYCQSLGGDLPTEAQFEYVASLRGRHLFPWGDAEPRCAVATVRLGIPEQLGGCGDGSPTPRPTVAGAATLDMVLLSTSAADAIWDLGGNLSEWVRDEYQADDGGCWASNAILYDPVCATGSDDSTVSRKGSSLRGYRVYSAQVRLETSRTDKLDDIGFRCAFPGDGR